MSQNSFAQVSKLLVFALVLGLLLPGSKALAVDGGGVTRGYGVGRSDAYYRAENWTTSKNFYYIGSEGVRELTDVEYGYDNVVFDVRDSKKLDIHPKTSSVGYWLQYYDKDGHLLHSSPNASGNKSIALPEGTGYVRLNANGSLDGRTLKMVARDLNDGADGIYAMGNYYVDGGRHSWRFGLGTKYQKYYYTSYPYAVEFGDTISFSKVGSNSYSVIGKVHYVDIDGNFIKTVNIGSPKEVGDINTTKVDNTLVTGFYFEIEVTDTYIENVTLSAVLGAYSININNGEEEKPVYPYDNQTYYPTTSSYNNYNVVNTPISNTNGWSAGDGSTVIQIDGNGNTVTVGGPSSNLDTINDTKEEPTGGFWGGVIDALKGIFGSLSSVLGGLIEILLIPVQFIIDTVADLIGMLRDVLASLGGLGEFFSEMFAFLPSPIPQLFVTFLGSMFVVAIVKMFM